MARIDLPDAHGTPVSHLQVSLQVVARFQHTFARTVPLSIGRLHEVIEALTATLVDEKVTEALAALTGVDPLVLPQPLGLDFVSSTDMPELLAGNGLTLVADAGTSRGAHPLAAPGIDQRDPAERRALIVHFRIRQCQERGSQSERRIGVAQCGGRYPLFSTVGQYLLTSARASGQDSGYVLSLPRDQGGTT